MKGNLVEDFDGVVVVGAGLVGAVSALLLSKKGYRVRIYELRGSFEEQREELENKKQSINLALSCRGQTTLKEAGVLGKAMKLAIPMYGRAIHNCDPRRKNVPLKIQLYDPVDTKNSINSISRLDLNALLVQELKLQKNVDIFFHHKLTYVQDEKSERIILNVENVQTKESFKISPTLVLGADGAFSQARNYLARFNFSNFSRTYIEHGYKELCLHSSGGQFKLKQYNYLHIWPKNEFMLIALPNLDKSFTLTLFAEWDALNLRSAEEIKTFFKKNFPDLFEGDAPLFTEDELVQQYLENPSSRLVSIKLDNWIFQTRNSSMVVVGDAAHACVPFYGQGMNAGLQDALVLCNHLPNVNGNAKNYLTSIQSGVEEFNRVRVKSGHVVAELSMYNYEVMKRKTNSKLFLVKKKFEFALNKVFGSRFIPLYKMVSFTNIPYAEIVDIDRRQQLQLQGLFAVTGLVGIGAAVLWGRQGQIKPVFKY
eukprot:maker-scaffold_12-snap-gene-12.9-mRNA-1 protein AED:0.00 eAED:0.00 QI:217/1/1/1/1/1/2/186/481